MTGQYAMRWMALMAVVTMAGCASVDEPAPPVPAAATTASLDGAALAEAKDCMVCHDVRFAKVGPAFRDVARRYANRANSRELLIDVVQTGSRSSATFGHWGNHDMPPDSVRVPVSEEEAAILVDYVLSLK